MRSAQLAPAPVNWTHIYQGLTLYPVPGEKLQKRKRDKKGKRKGEGQEEKGKGDGRGIAWGMLFRLRKCNVHTENNCRSLLKYCCVLPLTNNLLGRFIVYHYCYHKAFKTTGTQMSLLFFFYLIDLRRVFIGEEGKRVKLLIKKKGMRLPTSVIFHISMENQIIALLSTITY